MKMLWILSKNLHVSICINLILVRPLDYCLLASLPQPKDKGDYNGYAASLVWTQQCLSVTSLYAFSTGYA